MVAAVGATDNNPQSGDVAMSDTERCGTHGCDDEAVAVYKWMNIVTGETVETPQCRDCEPDELEPTCRLEANDRARGHRGLSGRMVKVTLGRWRLFVGATKDTNRGEDNE